ncbi:hypothetical protein TEA_023954 [Camellia sinensis var. sinensis]|uniref:pectinesterase n=1 Tax=Camellia sinensis var. sinensis TaxID=542762 RepID=A0A4S4CZM7_CAMSN|nr:hypothetical protein TEA_023954 [Camellia sinensis var. sinensis]
MGSLVAGFLVLFLGSIEVGSGKSQAYTMNYITWEDMKVDLQKERLDLNEEQNQSRVIVVDQNSKGDSVTVQGAVDMVPLLNSQRVKVYIHPGIYRAYGMQAVALRLAADKAMLYKVRDCVLHSTAERFGAIAAHHRDSQYDDTWFSFVNCTINGSGIVYLGRAWGNYSRVIYSYYDIDNIITPSGWSDWNQPSRQKTAMFGEYHCRGRGADRRNIVPWSKSLNYEEGTKKVEGIVVEYLDLRSRDPKDIGLKELNIVTKVLKSGCGRHNGGGGAVAVAGCKGRSVTVARYFEYAEFIFPGSEIPEWFSHQSRGCSVSFVLPPHWYNDRFLGFVFAVVGIKNKSKCCKCYYSIVIGNICSRVSELKTILFGAN